MGSYKTISVDTTVDVDIDLEDFDNDDLIDEMKERGYKVLEEDEEYVFLDKYDLETLAKFVGEQEIGSEMWGIREKIYGMLKWK